MDGRVFVARVLALAAHPDDEVLGPGGTLLRHKEEGDEVAIWYFHLCRLDERAEALRMIAASKRSGIAYHYEYPADIDAIVAKYVPDIVYTHWRGDLNADHRALHERVLVACRPQSGVSEVYAFDTASSTEWGIEPFVPDTFVGIDIEAKLDWMRVYDDELRDPPHPRSLDSLTARARYWGQVAGLDYAEAFRTIRRAR